MAFVAASSVLGAVGHLANLGQVAEVGQSRAHQREAMQWAHRAYRLDSRTLRIDLLNAVKEDVRDHYDTYAGRIDTLLLVHTLLLTFALATLQFSDEFVPQRSEDCPACVEAEHPNLVKVWVYLIAAILILPFWCILMLLYCKLKLDGWLEQSVRRLNNELRSTLSSQAFYDVTHKEKAVQEDRTFGGKDLESVEYAIARLGAFVCDHQDHFQKVWKGECQIMINCTTTLLWVNAVVAVSITAGMFWMFLMNRLDEHRNSANHFLGLMIVGLAAPLFYIAFQRIRCSLWKKSGDDDDIDRYVSFDESDDEHLRQGGYVPPTLPDVDGRSSVSPSVLRRLSAAVIGGAERDGSHESCCAEGTSTFQEASPFLETQGTSPFGTHRRSRRSHHGSIRRSKSLDVTALHRLGRSSSSMLDGRR